MAGAGYKLFNTGDVLTAAQVNTYLQEQVVMVFANAAARTTALSGVLAEGMVSYLKDTDAFEIYSGSAWVGYGSGDITGVTAGTGISGGGTSGTVTITNSMATEITAAGDIIVGTGSGTFDNLPIGTTGQVLTADTTVSPYKVKWAAAGSASYTWTSYTPALVNITQGNGTLSAAYVDLGAEVFYWFYFELGSTSVIGSGARIGIPLNVNTTNAGGYYNPTMMGSCFDTSASKLYAGIVGFPTNANLTISPFVTSTAGEYGITDLNANTPFTWATGDKIFLNIFYRKA